MPSFDQRNLRSELQIEKQIEAIIQLGVFCRHLGRQNLVEFIKK